MRNESTEHCATFFMPTACRAGTTSQRPGGETAGGARRDVAGRLGSVAKTRGITAVYECRLAVRRIASHHLTSARSHLPSDANRVRGEARGIPDHHWQRCPVPTPHARPLTARNTCQLSGHKFTLNSMLRQAVESSALFTLCSRIRAVYPKRSMTTWRHDAVGSVVALRG
jgi:hypothetical protein